MGLMRNGVPLRAPGGGAASNVYVAPPGGGGGGVSGDFVTTIIGSPDYQIVATSDSGEALSSGSFGIPDAGTYTVTIQGLAGPERTITIDNGSVSKTGDTSPFTVDEGGAVGDLTIVAGGANATVTVA